MQIIPAILTNKASEMDFWMKQIGARREFTRVQIDFVDGKYANNKSLEIKDCRSIKNYPRIKFDAHLMVVEENVVNWSEAARRAGFDRVVVQMESISYPERFTHLAMDIHSPLLAIEPFLKESELVLLMGVEPGFGGKKINPDISDKIRALNKLRFQKDYRFKIGVDGGVTRESLSEFENAGADEVVVGAGRVLEWRAT